MADKKSWRDYLPDETENQDETSGTKKTSWRDYVDYSQIVGENINDQMNAWLKNYNSYVSDYQDRFSGRTGTYEDAYVSDSADWLSSTRERKKALDAEADAILDYLNQYGGHLDSKTVEEIQKILTEGKSNQKKILDISKSDNDYWNQFGGKAAETLSLLPGAENVDFRERAYKNAQKKYGYFKKYEGLSTEDLKWAMEMLEDGNEKEWLTSYAASKDYDEKKKYDVDVGGHAIQTLENRIKYLQDFYLRGMDESLDHFKDRDEFLEERFKQYGGHEAMLKYIEDEQKRLDEMKKYSEEAQHIQKYEDYMNIVNAEDYAINSQFESTRNEVPKEDAYNALNNTYDTGMLFGDHRYDYVNRQEDAVSLDNANERVNDSDYYGTSDSFIETMTDDEIGVYNYLYKTKGPEAAEEFLSFMQSELETRKRRNRQQYWAELAEEDPVGYSAFSTLVSPLKGLTYIGQATDMLVNGEINENAGYNKFVDIPNAIRSQVSSTIENSGKWGKVGSFAYNTGMSMADFLFTTAVSGGNQALSLGIMGSGAAADMTLSAKDRGLDDAKAFTLGTIAGIAEIAMENISLGAWLNGDMTEGALKYVIKNALSEGGEEAGTSVINLLADVMISADKSEWNQAIQAYIKEGKSEAEAFGLVFAENAAQIGLDTLGGILSGSAIGGGTYAGTSIGAQVQYGGIGKNNALSQQIVGDGLKIDPNNKYAQNLKTKLDKGKNITGMQVRNILAANQEKITDNDIKSIQSAAQKMLSELGQKENVSKLAKLATKWATGQDLNRAEKSALTRSEYGNKVAHDLLENGIVQEMKSGDYSSKAIRTALENMAVAEITNAYKPLESRMEGETTAKVSDTGEAVINGTDQVVDLTHPKIKQISNDSVTLDVDGKEVNIDDIEFANEDQWSAFNALKKIEHITPLVANDMIAKVDFTKPVWQQLNGMDEAYTYGFYGYSEADLNAGLFTGNLTKEQLNDAYKLGQYERGKRDDAKADAYKQMRTAAQAQAEKEAKAEGKAKNLTITYNNKGTIVDFDPDKIGHKLTDDQKSAPALAKVFHKMGLGTNFQMYESYVKGNSRFYIDENGVERAAPSGVYRKSDGTILIDLNAYNGRGLTLDVMAHELTHFIQQWSDTKYKVLADFLVKTYEKTEMTMHQRVVHEQKRLENIRGEKVSYDEAFDEVVANAMSKMLADGNIAQHLTELRAQDENLAKKLWQKIKGLLNEFLNLVRSNDVLFSAAGDIQNLESEFKQMQRMWEEAFVEASENYQASLTVSESQTLAEAGIGFDVDTQSVYSLHFSNAYTEQLQVGKKTFNSDAIAKLVSKATNRSIEDARAWVQSEMTIANIVMQNPEFLDFEADNRYEAIKKNSDYPQGTVDLSNLCPKREEFTTMFDMLQKKYPNKLFTAQDVAEMRKILSDNDITVACGACFVEDRRQLLGEIADTYINMWKEAVETGKPLQKTNAAGVKSDLLVTKALAKQYGLTAGEKIMATDTYIPNQYDLTTYEGFKLLEKNHPTIAMGFNRYNNSRGQQSARLIEGRAEYKRQILGWSDAKVRTVNNNGGLRIFSFSDFEVVHLLDLVQVIIDCAAKGVKIQGYTKIPAFAKLVRNTGVKLNRSLIPSGDYGYHMENGKVVLDYDTTEGININDENFMDESDNPNVGNIVIGINPTQIGAAMLDPFIDYIIPFHSNKAKEILRKLGTGEWVNYKESQHEKDIATGTSSKHNVNIYTEVINKYHPTNKVEFVDAFLKECKRQGKIPRYAEFLNVDANGDYAYREGYHKLLVDFKMFDAEGNILPQGNITPNLDESFMKDLLNAEIDKKQNYEFPQKVYDDIDKKFGEQYSSQETDIDTDIEAGYDGVGLEDVLDVLSKGVGIKWNNGNVIKLDSKEYGAVVSRISTKYKRQETHGGVQYIERSTDKDAKFYLYLYIDHGFDNYEIIARLDYSKQEELIHRLRRIIQNGRNAGEVLDGTEQLRDIDGSVNSSGVSNQNRSLSKTDDKKTTGRSGQQRARNNGQVGSEGSGRLDERSNGTSKINQEMYSVHDLPSMDAYEEKLPTMRELWDDIAKISLRISDLEMNLRGANRNGYVNAIERIHGEFDEVKNRYIEYGKYLLKNYEKYSLNDIRRLSKALRLVETFEEAKAYTIEQFKKDLTAKVNEYRKDTADSWSKEVKTMSRDDRKLLLALKLMAAKEGHDVSSFDVESESFHEDDWLIDESMIPFSTHETDYSNRSLLANAFEGLTKSSIEYKLIQKYKGRIRILNEYEAKLDKVNAQIHKIRFTKGKYNAERLRILEAEAKNLANEINRNDRELLSLEASEPLRKLIASERKKEAQKTKEHVNEILQNKKVRAEQTELRHKIRKAVRDLDKLLNRGNKKQNVKEDMKGFVSKALDLADYLFTDHISNDDLIRRGIDPSLIRGEREARLVKETEEILFKLYEDADSLTDKEFARLDDKRKANEEKLRDLLKAQRNKVQSTPVYNLFNDLVIEYASLKNSKQDAVKAAYNDKVEEHLRTFLGNEDSDRAKVLQNMRVADMTTDELWKLYNAYTMVLTTVRDANKFHVQGMNQTIEQVVGQISSDFSRRKIPEKKLAIAAQKIANKIGWDYEKLYYALDRIGSDAFTKLITNLADSENIVMQDVIEAIEFRDQIVEKYGFNNWAVNKEIDREFLDNTGKKFKMTLGQLMSLYAYSRRAGAWDHIEYGGFVFGEAALTNPRPADSYKLTKNQVYAITSLLTKEQKGYVEAMQKFLSETMGAKGNEVSMKLYGIKMFGEKNYFPIHIAGQFKAQADESQAKAAAGFQSMSNAGFTNAQNPNAKAPFVLEGFNEIWSDHVNEMSRYHGTVPALEDIRRVMNRSTYMDAMTESQSIKQLMENQYGKEAVEYFNNLYREANSGAITDRMQKPLQKLLGFFRKNSVAYSLSVVIQQPSAMSRAYAMIDKKYFGFKGVGALTSGVIKAVSSKWNPAYANAYSEMKKYAPGVTMAKEIGGFDTHTGTSIRQYLLDTGKSFKQSMKTENLKGKGSAVLGLVDDNAIANLPAVADKIAWIEIWNACKRETLAKHKTLAPTSEEFMQIVGNRFTEVIRATQVYDSMFSKSPMLKSKSLAVQYIVSFMNEPNTTVNMVEKAVRDVTKGDWKSGVRTAVAVTSSIIFNNVLKSVIYAMRDDDEDETYIEKYAEAITSGLVSDFNPLSYIPYVRDVMSKVQGYDVERPDMAIVTDAIEAYQAIVKNINKDTENLTEYQIAELDKKVTDASWKLVGSLAAFLGIPVKNIYREIDGIIDHARIASANAGMTTLDSVWDKVTASIPLLGTETSKGDKLYEAILDGDQAYIDRLKNSYVDKHGNFDKSKYDSAVRKALRENDSRIREAAQARYDGDTDEYKRIFREIQNEGKFSFDEIMDAINSEENAIKNKLEPDKVTSNYNASDFVQAVSMGDTETASAARDDIIDTHIANGKTQEEAEEEFASDVTTGTHEAYSAGLLDDTGAENMLIEYAGMDEEDATSRVSYWAFLDAHPEYDQYKLTEANVRKYHEFAEPAEIPMEVFVQFRDRTKGLTNIKDEWGDVDVSKEEQVIEVIESLPLSRQQKDALFLACGYSKDSLWKVTW